MRILGILNTCLGRHCGSQHNRAGQRRTRRSLLAKDYQVLTGTLLVLKMYQTFESLVSCQTFSAGNHSFMTHRLAINLFVQNGSLECKVHLIRL